LYPADRVGEMHHDRPATTDGCFRLLHGDTLLVCRGQTTHTGRFKPAN
jgi:hypothetical protein